MEQFDGFEFDKRNDLGKGQYAIVYKGRFIETPDVPVAIKAIAKKDLGKTREQLTKEINILRKLSKLRHENVVALHKCAETPTHVYLVMEYCNGGDLADYLYHNGTLCEEAIQSFMVQISKALETMQTMGIVHRDLKPQNILLCHSGRSQNPNYAEISIKLADFGFARFLKDGVMATTFCGSPLYMAPEVIVDQIYDARADLYSIGVIFFQCLTGKPPFVAQTPIQLKNFYERSLELKPKVPEWCSEGLRDLLTRTLKRNAANRMSFDEFFIHPFLKEPLKPTPSKRILEGASAIGNQKIIFPNSSSVTKPAVRQIAKASTQEPVVVKSSLAQRTLIRANTDAAISKPAMRASTQIEPAARTTTGVRKMPNPFLEPRHPPRKLEIMEESVEGFTWLHSPGEIRRKVKGTSSSNRTTSSSYSKPRPDPVPVHTQRVVYQKMKENLEELNKPPTPAPKKTQKTPKVPELSQERKGTAPWDIEKMAVPCLNFVILGDGKRLAEKVMKEPTIIGNLEVKERKTSDSPSDEDDDSLSFPFASSSPTELANTSPPPPLDQDAFLGDYHKQTLAKLAFVANLADSLIHLAEQKDNPLASAMAFRRQLLTTGTSTTNTSSPYRRAEQLVVYLRALKMLSSALSMAQKDVKNGELQLTKGVKEVVNRIHERYQMCLARSQDLASLGLPTDDPSLTQISADKVIYRYAIDQCQAAALDELFGNPHLCGKRYQTAHIMLHTLAEQAGCEKKREMYRRYKIGVENRLRGLEQQGYVSVV